jgi:hypothetical protein
MTSKLTAIFILLYSLTCLLKADTLAHKLTPGKTVFIDFPKLGKTWANKESRMGVFLPEDYSLERTYPLFVWFGGGYGSDNPNHAINIAGRKGFICVGLPYHHDGRQGELSTGGWAHTPWSYFKTMLTELEKSVPNINPQQRFCSGFSSGGAAIVSLIGRTNGAFQEYFYAFMPGGAAGEIKGFDTIKGRPMYAFMGKKDSRINGYKRLEKEAQKAGIDITALFYDAGHSMPNKHYAEMRQWIMAKIIMRGVPELLQSMHANMKKKKYGSAYQAANQIFHNVPPHMPEYTQAQELRTKLLPYGKSMAESLQKQQPADLKKMMAFSLAWKGSDFAKPIEEKCSAYAEKQLSKILGQRNISTSYLVKFIHFWKGFDITQKAQDKYDDLAEIEIKKILSRKASPSSKLGYLKQFIQKWKYSTKVSQAQDEINALAKTDLDEIRKVSRASSKKLKLKNFIRKYAGTEQVAEAQALLDKL